MLLAQCKCNLFYLVALIIATLGLFDSMLNAVEWVVLETGKKVKTRFGLKTNGKGFNGNWCPLNKQRSSWTKSNCFEEGWQYARTY